MQLLHQKLLAVGNFAFYQSLEGDKFTPHISVAKILNDKGAKEEVEKILHSQANQPAILKLTDFEINLPSPNNLLSERIKL